MASSSGTDAGWQAICPLVDQAAAANRLPSGLLTRILWQESHFRADATGPAGAEGVAQFMPATAIEHGLADPRKSTPAIAEAARLLASLQTRFGNIGLAAAAYNAGAGRIAKWLVAKADLPKETRIYVRAVTGQPIEDWIGLPADLPTVRQIWSDTCVHAMAKIGGSGPAALKSRPLWQVRLDRTIVQAFGIIAAQPEPATERSRISRRARALCERIRSLGAHCVVYSR